jgi:hypothetical protein
MAVDLDVGLGEQRRGGLSAARRTSAASSSAARIRRSRRLPKPSPPALVGAVLPTASPTSITTPQFLEAHR